MWARGLGAALVVFAASAASAQENNDLNLIPESVQTQEPQASAPSAESLDTHQRIYLENAFTLDSERATLVPAPPPSAPNWEERLFLDARKTWQIAPGLSAAYSGRFNLRAEDALPFPSHENVRNDLREASVSWSPRDDVYFDIGRINLKNGVAAGFNPTDFFKTRAVVEPLSSDPAVLREDRLGTAMARAQKIFEGGALSVAFAPKLDDPRPIYTNLDLPSFRPMFDRTNGRDRLLISGNYQLAEDFAPELLYYREGSASRFGLNLTRSVGQKIVLYGEWAGGDQPDLISSALSFGRETGTIPFAAPTVLPVNTATNFGNQLSLGGSYTTESKITFNLEYHYNEMGFSPQDWRNWFRVGTANTNRTGVTQGLWYIRNYALDQQEPIDRNSVFLRADWTDAFVTDLELTALATVDLHDGSSLMQVSADYALTREWTVGALAAGTIGTKRSNFGSLPEAASILLKLIRYF